MRLRTIQMQQPWLDSLVLVRRRSSPPLQKRRDWITTPFNESRADRGGRNAQDQPQRISHGKAARRQSQDSSVKISFGCTRDFRVNMWGTSLPEDKLAGDLGNVIGATSIGGRRSDFFTARKLAPGNLGLLQQYRHKQAPESRRWMVCLLRYCGR